MILSELKSLLAAHPQHAFRLLLPDGDAVPVSFHITEVGRVHKAFLDCGGTPRETTTCQLQVWVGQDYNHRIETGKMASILEKGTSLLPDESVPVESAMKAYERLKAAYEAWGCPQAVALDVFAGGREFHTQTAVEWMDRWLRDK